jgi:hypothetical protein
MYASCVPFSFFAMLQSFVSVCRSHGRRENIYKLGGFLVKHTKRLLSIALAVIMVMALVPMVSAATYSSEADIISAAEARKATILGNTATVNVTGTKYYVSNSGNDSNDGKTPQTAWATIDKVNAASLKPGDGVFFQRGGIWRNIQLKTKDGVTYSAYGEGSKPSFYGWLEDGANPAYWTLIPGSTNVWEYHRDINECGTIVFNGGEKTAEKYAAFWNVKSKSYVVSLDMKTPFTVNLLKNNQFFNEVDLTEATGIQFPDDDYHQDSTSYAENGSSLLLYGLDNRGKLYLRCDEGNPGNVYNSIEFATDAHGGRTGNKGGDFIRLEKNTVIDNLCIKYGAGLAMHLNHGVVIQNCEIAYIGGGAYAYTPIENHPDRTDPNFALSRMILLDGNAIIGVSDIHPSNVKIQNNYIHQIYDKAFNLEYSMGNTLENISISGNLFERNGAGTNIYNFFPNDQENSVRFKNIVTDDNFFMYTGYGWHKGNTNGNADNWNNNILNCEFYRQSQFENVVYSNNVFYLPAYGFFHLSGDSSLEPLTFRSNTYVHTNGGVILRDDTRNGGHKRYYYNENAEQTIKQLTGDTTATVIFQSDTPVTPPANPIDSASTWARENITSALAKGFIPADIQGDYTAPITRQEFCRMAVKFVEYYTGKSIDAVMADKGVVRQQNAFSDTNDQDILAAYALGITSGTVAPTATSPGKFDPDSQFNREQAATMLQRVCRVVGMNANAVADQGYTDISSASSWAVEAINYCYANKIMTGTSTTPLTFSPKDTYSREQSIITFDRIVPGTATPEPTPPATATDKPFNSAAQSFLNGLPAEAKEGIEWTRKSYDGIEFIEAYRDNGTKKPVMFVLHGGGGSKENVMGELDMYAHEGFHAVALDAAAHGESDRGPLLNLDAWVETVGYIDTLIDFYGTSSIADASRFGVAGGSMGGSITFLYGVIGEHTPKVLLPEIGSADFTQVLNGRANGITDHGQGKGEQSVTPALTARALELSAVSNVERFVNIPMWACFGSEDYENGIEGSREFIKLLKEAGGTIQELKVIEGGGHGGFADSNYATRISYVKRHMGM